MAHDATKGAGGWRGSRSTRSAPGPKRTAATKWTEAAILSTMMLIVAGFAVWLLILFFRPLNPKAYFVPFWVGTYQDRLGIPTVPWMQADRSAIVGDKRNVFSKIDKKEALDQPLETMKERLDGLLERTGDDAVVVYISAYAVVDTEGKIRILAKDSHPYEPDTQLPLGRVLDAIEHCKSKNKLLVLDIMRNMLDPRDLGATADGVGTLVRRELQDGKNPDVLNDPDLTVICACSPGECALGSENLGSGRSAFGFFFEQGLTKSEADTNRDNLIDVQELQEYVARHVDDWAIRYRGVHQQPYLAGATDRNFPLRAIEASSANGGWASLWPFGRSKNAPGPEGSAAEPAADTPVHDEKTKGEPSGPSASKDQTKDADASVSDAQSSTKEKAKKTEKATSKEPAAKGPAKEADDGSSPSRQREYPDWLAAGWDAYQEWWKSGDFRAAPRVYRRLGAMLLRAERRWRGGDNVREVSDELKSELQARVSNMNDAKKIQRPSPRSAGLAIALGQPTDVGLKGAIEEALAKWREINPNDPKGVEARTGIEKGLVALLKGKTSIEFALALVAASYKAPLDRPTLTFLDSIVDRSRTIFDDKDQPSQVVELRFLRQLAERSKTSPPNDWWDLADQAWNTVFLAEQASFQPYSLAWVRARLDEADASLHYAQVLLLTQPRGYASWKNQIAAAWEKTAALYQSVRDQQDAIQVAQTTFTKTLTVLSCLIPCLEARTDLELQQDWLDAARAARDLAPLLDPPDDRETSPDQIDTQITKLSGEAEKLDRKCKRLLLRFQPDAVKKLVADCRSDTVAPDPKRILEIEALLATPFLPASDRQNLRDAERSLEERLETHSTGNRVASSEIGQSDLLRTRVQNRFDRIVEFLKLSGLEGKAQNAKGLEGFLQSARELQGTTGAKSSSSKSNSDKIWRAMAEVAQYAYRSFTDRLRNDKLIADIDPAGLLAPLYALRLSESNATGAEDNPCRAARERASLKACSWLAAHYRHQSLDLPDLVDADKFYEGAATNCPPGPDPLEVYPQIQVLDAGGRPVTDPVGLNTENRRGQVSLDLRLLGNLDAANASRVELSVLQSADSRLRVTPVPKERNLSSEATRLSVQFELSTEGNSSQTAPPEEFFVQLKLENGRKYHARIPITIVTGELIPRLVLSTDPAKPKNVAEDKVRLRPIPGLRQPYHVFVENRTGKAVEVIVAVMEGSTIKASSGTKEMPTIKVKAGESELVRSFAGSPARKDADPLPKLAEPIELWMRDAATNEVIQKLPLPVVFASPRDYIQVTSREFLPARPGVPNRLTVVINPLPGLGDRPCPVELVLPEDRDLFPAFKSQPQGGSQARVLEADGKPVILIAENIPLNLNVEDTKPSYFYLNVDGLEKADAVMRAFWFKTTFRQEGPRQPVTEDQTPRVRFEAETRVSKGSPAKLLVKFAVDNPPPGAKLTFQLLREEEGQEVAEWNVPWSAPAKDRQLGFDIKGDSGALLFEASEKDWVQDFNINGVHGSRWLEARLVDATGKNVAEPSRKRMELDDRPPQNMAIEAAPDQIERGTPEVAVVASVTPPPAMKEVAFVVGTKKVTDAEFDKAESDEKTIKGVSPDNGRSWKAKLKVPGDVSDKLVITARFKPVAGLTELFSTEVKVVDPAAAPKDKAKAAMEPPKPGSIEGKVTIAGRPQPELTVVLYFFDTKTNKYELIDKTTTTDKGAYKFKDVSAKTYTVYCYKLSDGRKDAQQAVVKPGETITVDLKLVQ
jgi:hypothetical protein